MLCRPLLSVFLECYDVVERHSGGRGPITLAMRDGIRCFRRLVWMGCIRPDAELSTTVTCSDGPLGGCGVHVADVSLDLDFRRWASPCERWAVAPRETPLGVSGAALHARSGTG